MLLISFDRFHLIDFNGWFHLIYISIVWIFSFSSIWLMRFFLRNNFSVSLTWSFYFYWFSSETSKWYLESTAELNALSTGIFNRFEWFKNYPLTSRSLYRNSVVFVSIVHGGRWVLESVGACIAGSKSPFTCSKREQGRFVMAQTTSRDDAPPGVQLSCAQFLCSFLITRSISETRREW